jgi:hypothetical protein
MNTKRLTLRQAPIPDIIAPDRAIAIMKINVFSAKVDDGRIPNPATNAATVPATDIPKLTGSRTRRSGSSSSAGLSEETSW